MLPLWMFHGLMFEVQKMCGSDTRYSSRFHGIGERNLAINCSSLFCVRFNERIICLSSFGTDFNLPVGLLRFRISSRKSLFNVAGSTSQSNSLQASYIR